MSGEQPAEQLARIKRQHPLWTIRHCSEGYGFEAVRDGHTRLWSLILANLESMLNAVKGGRTP